MKKSVVLAATLLFCTALFAQKKPARKHADLMVSESGKPLYEKDVKDKSGKVTEKGFYYKDGNALEHKELYTAGKITEADYYADGRLSFKTTFDDKGRETSTTFMNSDGTIHSKSVYTHMPDGTAKTTTYNNDGVKESEETVDDQQRTLEKTEYKSDGSLSSKEVNKYDGKIGQCHKTETTVTDANGNVIRKETFNHDTKQNETTVYYKNGKMQEHDIQENAFSLNSYYRQMDSYEEDGSYRTQTMKSFTHGNITSSEPADIHWYDKDGKLSLRSVSTYSSQGYKEQEDLYDGSGKLMYKDTYTNDANGNTTDILRTYPDGKTEYVKKDGKDLK